MRAEIVEAVKGAFWGEVNGCGCDDNDIDLCNAHAEAIARAVLAAAVAALPSAGPSGLFVQIDGQLVGRTELLAALTGESADQREGT